MKLLLTSAGIRTAELADALTGLSGRSPDKLRIAVINEASAVETGDKTWLIDEINYLRKHFGGYVDFINLLALDIEEVRERMVHADVIYVIGGNPDYLMHIYQKTGFAQVLRDELLNQKIYVGSSAGSMVLGRRGSTGEYQRCYGEDRTFGAVGYMEVVDFIVMPHFDSVDWPANNKATLLQASADEQGPIYAIRDEQAIVVCDNEISSVGGDVFAVSGVLISNKGFIGEANT